MAHVSVARAGVLANLFILVLLLTSLGSAAENSLPAVWREVPQHSTKDVGDIVRMTPSWWPRYGLAIGEGILFAEGFIYPNQFGYPEPYLITTTQIAYCANDDTLVPVLTTIPHGVSIAAVGDGVAHIVGGVVIEAEDEYYGRIYPTRLHTSADGLNWTTLPDSPDIMWKMPYNLFKAHGCLYLECAALDLRVFYAQFGITLDSGLLMDLNLAQLPMMESNAPLVYRSCDNGVSWTEVQNVPWHELNIFSIPQYDVAYNGRHYARAVTDINNPVHAQSYLFYAANDHVWNSMDIIPGALYPQFFSLAVSDDGLYAIAADSYFYYPYDFSTYEGVTVWKSVNGVDWAAHSLQVPAGTKMVASSNYFAAAPFEFENYMIKTPGIYYSQDGAGWFLWKDWPADCEEHSCAANPLILTEDALYLTVGINSGWPTTELWRMPLTIFSSDGPPRVTISRAINQPAHATAFPVVFDILWSEPINDFTTSDILLDGFYYLLTESSQWGDRMHYTLTVTGISTTLTESIIAPEILANMALDDTSTPNEAADCVNAQVVLNLPPEMPAYQHWLGVLLIALLAAVGATVIHSKIVSIRRQSSLRPM